jgi:branched-chain amino acid transport system substrate-binding protein
MRRIGIKVDGNLFSVTLALLLLGFLLGSAAGPDKALAEEKELIIGGALSLTGIQAPLDVPGLKGAQVAVDYLNSKGGILGRKVKFINLDGKSDPVTVGNVIVQLIQKGAELVVAPCDFDFGGPASREAQKAGMVGISTCASSPLYSSYALGDKQFTLSMWNSTMGAAAAEYAYEVKGWKTAYVVTDTFIDYTTSLSELFIKAFEMYGGKVFAEDKYTQGDLDFSAQLARIQALKEKPDLLYISSYMPDLGAIIRAIREVGINTPIMGGDSYDDTGSAPWGQNLAMTSGSLPIAGWAPKPRLI